jgi:hypothetical protein
VRNHPWVLALTIENLEKDAGSLLFNFKSHEVWHYDEEGNIVGDREWWNGDFPDMPLSFTMNGTSMMVDFPETVVGNTHYVHNAGAQDITYCSDTDEIKVALISQLPLILKRSPCGMTHQDTTMTMTTTPSPCSGTGTLEVGSGGLCYEGSSVTRCDPGTLALTIEDLEDGAGHMLFNYTVPEGRYSDWADEPLSFTMSSTETFRSTEAQRFIGGGGVPMKVRFGRDGAYVMDVVYCSATDEIYVDFLIHGPMILKRSSCSSRGRHTTTTTFPRRAVTMV